MSFLKDLGFFCLFFTCFLLASCLASYIIRRYFPEHINVISRTVEVNSIETTLGRSSLPTYLDATKNDPPSYTECFRETQQSSTYAVNV